MPQTRTGGWAQAMGLILQMVSGLTGASVTSGRLTLKAGAEPQMIR